MKITELDPNALAGPFLTRAHRTLHADLARAANRKRRQRERFEAAVAPLRESYAYLLDESSDELREIVALIEETVPGGAAPHWFALRAFLGLDADLL